MNANANTTMKIHDKDSLSDPMIEALSTLREAEEDLVGIRTALFGTAPVSGPSVGNDEEPCAFSCAKQTLAYARSIRERAAELRARM